MSSVSVIISPVYLFCLATVAMLLGPIAYRTLKRKGWAIALLDAFVMVAILGLLAFHVLPEAFNVLGVWVAIPAAAGLALPFFVGRIDRFGSRTADGLALALAIAGLAMHTMLDGVALANADDPGRGTTELALAVVLHRIPVGMFVWHVPRTVFGRRSAIGLLALIVTSTGVGMTLGAQYLGALDGPVFAGFQALIAGSLLHVVLGHSHHEHGPASESRVRLGEAMGAILAVASLLAISQLGAGDHLHDDVAGLPSQIVTVLAIALVLPLLREGPRRWILGFFRPTSKEHEHRH